MKTEKKPIVHRKVMEPRTTKEATNMIIKGWMWLTKKYPVFLLPLTLWMLFGGGIYLYNYMNANKVEIKEAKPISQLVQPKTNFSIMSSAIAGEKIEKKVSREIPIIFDGQLWGYEDTLLVAKAVKDKGMILVYNKNTHKVYQVLFDVDYRMKFSK